MGKTFYKAGQRYTNTRGIEVELLERTSRSSWLVKTLEHNFLFEIHQSQLLSQAFKTPSCKSVYGVGYFGVGMNKCRGSDGKITLEYSVWSNMIKRCYTDYVGNKTPRSYTNALVCDEWHNFQTFANWFNPLAKNFRDNNIIPKLDKDLIGNSVLYSPDNCCLLPNILNCSIIENRINSTVHIGISEADGRYKAAATHNYKGIHLGIFDTKEEAINKYTEYKKGILVKLAQEYKHVIDERTYTKLLNWSPNNE